MGVPARQFDPLPGPLRAPRPIRRPGPTRRPKPTRRPGHPVRQRTRPDRRHVHRPVIRRTLNAVGQLPETGLIRGVVRRPPLWICAIGLLAISIVFINVAGISYSARAGKLEAEIQQLERKNSILRSSQTRAMAMPRIRDRAAAAGMAMPAPDRIQYVTFEPGDIESAAARLAAEAG